MLYLGMIYISSFLMTSISFPSARVFNFRIVICIINMLTRLLIKAVSNTIKNVNGKCKPRQFHSIRIMTRDQISSKLGNSTANVDGVLPKSNFISKCYWFSLIIAQLATKNTVLSDSKPIQVRQYILFEQ